MAGDAAPGILSNILKKSIPADPFTGNALIFTECYRLLRITISL
jgi:hypothetical protein